MPNPIIANSPQIEFKENEMIGVAYDKRIGQWYSVHATCTETGWTCERRDMRRIPYNEPTDSAIIAGLLDAAGIPRLEADGRILLLWERVYQLADLAQAAVAPVGLVLLQSLANSMAARQQAQLREVYA